ncbi:MAG TPA: hypothetical protein VMB03_18705 [Bryobacteraceae bacterium]|nr:hypothetical protein [Bryobacteraceae bacterium]
MLADFIYRFHTWVIGFIVVGIWTGLALLGLRHVHRRIDVNTRHKDTETVGLTFAIVGLIYGVLMALMVINVMANFSASSALATSEASAVNSLLIDSDGLAPSIAEPVRVDLEKYLDTVVKKEWPSQHEGKLGESVFEEGWTILAAANTRIATFEPATMGQNVLKGEMLRGINDLIRARRARILAAGDHLPAVVWKMLLLGGATIVVYTYLFGPHSYAIHVAVTGLITVSISIVFVLMIALDYPFRGVVSVSSDPYLGVQTTFAPAHRAFGRVPLPENEGRAANANTIRPRSKAEETPR